MYLPPPRTLEFIIWKNTIKVDQKILKIPTNCLSDVTVFWLISFDLLCSLADYWQTQSLCIHKELMKRTIGKPTYAFEARDYVVSLPVTPGHAVTAQALTPVAAARLGTQVLSDPDARRSLLAPTQPQAPSSRKVACKKEPNLLITSFLKTSVGWACVSPLCFYWDRCLRWCHQVWFYGRTSPLTRSWSRENHALADSRVWLPYPHAHLKQMGP